MDALDGAGTVVWRENLGSIDYSGYGTKRPNLRDEAAAAAETVRIRLVRDGVTLSEDSRVIE